MWFGLTIACWTILVFSGLGQGLIFVFGNNPAVNKPPKFSKEYILSLCFPPEAYQGKFRRNDLCFQRIEIGVHFPEQERVSPVCLRLCEER